VTDSDAITRNFYAWELRGRGWQAYTRTVCLEPPFRPFLGHVLPRRRASDEGKIETKASSFAGWFFKREGDSGRRSEPEEEAFLEPEPEIFRAPYPLSEIVVSLPPGAAVSPGVTENLLVALAAARFPLAFEVVGLRESVRVGVACRAPDRERVSGFLKAHFPEAIVGESPEPLRAAWRSARGVSVALEFGLAREFMLPLRTFRDFRPDPLLAIYAALAELHAGEAGLFQVLFTPAACAWGESIWRAVHTPQGHPFFTDDPEFTKLANEKVMHPFFAVAVRMGARTKDEVRAWDLLRGMTSALHLLGHANELTPLAEEEEIDLEEDLLARTSHRSGMLLTTPELAGIVHLPGESVRLEALARETRRTRAAPRDVLEAGLLIGENLHEGRAVEVRLPPDLRTRHTHLVGASGTGKSTLLVNLILEDLASGGGLAVLDPHGDLIDEILARYPEEREGDLILFDPSDTSFRVGWNMLQARTEVEKIILSSDLVAAFRRLSTSWGDQMTSVLGNTIQAFVESDSGGTLLDLRQFLLERDFRAGFLRTVEDPDIRYYFERQFPLLKGIPQGPILTRLDTFLRSKLVRAVVTERKNRLDFRELVDGGRVFLAKLAQGAVGEENASLLGSLLVSTFHQAALSRQDLAPGARRPFSLYVDECHHFATPSMAALLSGARKYRLSLCAAHQELSQLRARDPEVLSALLANAGTRIVFRVGEADARELERGFSSFAAEDLVRLKVGEAIVRAGRSDADFNLRTRELVAVAPEDASARRERLLTLMREQFPVPPPEPRKEDRPPAPIPRERVPVPPALVSPAPPTVVPPPPPPPRPAEPPSLGRGGPEHQYLQDLVKRWAESHGYRATIEEEIPGGRGKVDVALRTDDFSLACEISVTSTVAQEIGNALKCLEAGFHEVAILALKRPRLSKIEAALKAKLPPSDLARVHLVSPEELFTMLSMRPVTKEKVVGGYKVRVRRTPVDSEEEAARYEALKEVIGKSLRRMGKKEKP
jgi:type IV secretion system coupling TraD/TrwB family protein/type IV secretory system conjugative DNA transfer VirD4/TraG family protein